MLDTKIPASIGHNSGETADQLPHELVFADPDYLDRLHAEYETKIKTFDYDLTTTEGRKAIKAFGTEIVSIKTAIEKEGVTRNEVHNKAIKATNAIRKRAKSLFEELRDTARKPLTDWENAEEARASYISETQALFEKVEQPVFPSIEVIDDYVSKIEERELTEATFGTLLDTFVTKREAALKHLAQHRTALEDRAAEQAELAELRADKARREAAAQAKAEEARKAEQAKQQKLEQEQRDKEVADKAKANALKQQELAAKKAEDERVKREQDAAYRAAIAGKAASALVEQTGIEADQAVAVFEAIADKKIPNLFVDF